MSLILGRGGFRITSSPTVYGGADLRVAQNVVLSRSGNVEGLSKRPGLSPLGVAFAPPVLGFIPVPLVDPLSADISIQTPEVSTASSAVVEVDKFAAWTTDLQDLLAMRLLATTETRVFYAGNDHDPSNEDESPTLYVDTGTNKIPYLTPNPSDDRKTDVISCVRALRLPRGTPVVYMATASFGATDTKLNIYQIDTVANTTRLVVPELAFRGEHIVADIVHRNGRVLIITASNDGDAKGYSIAVERSLRGTDGWREEFTLPSVNPVSAVLAPDGVVYIGCSNRQDTSIPAAVYALTPGNSDPEVSHSTPPTVAVSWEGWCPTATRSTPWSG